MPDRRRLGVGRRRRNPAGQESRLRREARRHPQHGRAETRRAIAAAAPALPAWGARTAKDRAAVLRRWFDLIVQNEQDLATLMTAEQGKPLAEARARSPMRHRSSNGSRKRASASTATSFRAIKPTSGFSCCANRSASWPPSRPGISRGDDHPQGGARARRRMHHGAEACDANAVSALALAELALRAGIPAGVFNV